LSKKRNVEVDKWLVDSVVQPGYLASKFYGDVAGAVELYLRTFVNMLYVCGLFLTLSLFGDSFLVQPTDVTRTQYTNFRLCSAS
jgi:hypothetical protein